MCNSPVGYISSTQQLRQFLRHRQCANSAMMVFVRSLPKKMRLKEVWKCQWQPCIKLEKLHSRSHRPLCGWHYSFAISILSLLFLHVAGTGFPNFTFALRTLFPLWPFTVTDELVLQTWPRSGQAQRCAYVYVISLQSCRLSNKRRMVDMRKVKLYVGDYKPKSRSRGFTAAASRGFAAGQSSGGSASPVWA